MIHRMASIQPSSGITVRAGLRRFALICAAPVLLACVQLALDMSELLANAVFPEYVWLICDASQDYYLYFLFAPLRKLLPLELRLAEDSSVAISTTDREGEYLSASGNTELMKVPFQASPQAQEKSGENTRTNENSEDGIGLGDVQVDIGLVYSQNAGH